MWPLFLASARFECVAGPVTVGVGCHQWSLGPRNGSTVLLLRSTAGSVPTGLAMAHVRNSAGSRGSSQNVKKDLWAG